MITVHGMKKVTDGGEPYDFELIGLSTDTKPSTINGYDIGVNSYFLEADTGDFYYLSNKPTEEIIAPSESLTWASAEYLFQATPNITQLPESPPESIRVNINGHLYELPFAMTSQNSNVYGELENNLPSFNNYPVMVVLNYGDGLEPLVVYAPTNDSMIFSAYTMSNAVWAKIGGGGSSPTPSGELLYEATLDNWLENQGIYVEMDFIDKLFPDDITVEWDEVMYQCVRNEDFNTWGATPTGQELDWSTYPFAFGIDTANMEIQIASPTDGTHTIKVYGEAPEPTLVTVYNGSFVADHQQMNAYYYSVPNQDMDFAKLQTDKIHVTFDNVEYTLNNEGDEEQRWFGAPFAGFDDNWDFSTCPFCIYLNGDRWYVRFYVGDTNSHDIKIEAYV